MINTCKCMAFGLGRVAVVWLKAKMVFINFSANQCAESACIRIAVISRYLVM